MRPKILMLRKQMPETYHERLLRCKAEGARAAREGKSSVNPYGVNIDEIFSRCCWQSGFSDY